jgi:hypothetical protein
MAELISPSWVDRLPLPWQVALALPAAVIRLTGLPLALVIGFAGAWLFGEGLDDEDAFEAWAGRLAERAFHLGRVLVAVAAAAGLWVLCLR